MPERLAGFITGLPLIQLQDQDTEQHLATVPEHHRKAAPTQLQRVFHDCHQVLVLVLGDRQFVRVVLAPA
ncbi:hypothetical protein D3C76_1091710 [compost metagenome]